MFSMIFFRISLTTSFQAVANDMQFDNFNCRQAIEICKLFDRNWNRIFLFLLEHQATSI